MTKTEKHTRPIVFDMTANQCVWAKAGVVKPTLCLNAFDCTTCPLDKKIQQDIAAGKLKDAQGRPAVSWRDPAYWVKLSQNQKKCRHMLTGRVPVKYCTNAFNCAKCPYDELIEQEDLLEPANGVGWEVISGFALAQNYYYHRGHAWARVEYGGRIRVGLDDFALRLVGPVDEFKLPELGAVTRQSEPEVGLARGELRAETLSPVEGVVVARNPKVLERAATANQDPYQDGWLMGIQPTKLKTNLRNLLFGEESAAWMEEESGRLSAMVAKETGHALAATGGRIVDDIYSQVPELSWERLVSEFLLT